MRKEIQKAKYVVAMLITLLVFMSGVLFGANFQYKRAQTLDASIEDIKQSYGDILVQYQYMQELEEEKDCTSLNLLFQTSLDDLNFKRQRLEKYDTQDKLDEVDYEKLRSSYTTSQLNYWILSKRLKNICTFDYSIVIYFFDKPTRCELCEDQGTHLDYVKKLLEDKVLVFALDGNEEGLVSLLKKKYNVTSYPTLIIDENVTGFKNNQDILKTICPGKDIEACKKYN